MPNKTDRLPHLAMVYMAWDGLLESDEVGAVQEYTEEQLACAYPNLDEVQLSYLRELIQLPYNKDYRSLYSMLPSNDAQPDAQLRKDCVCETLGEAMHQGLEGWSDGEKVVIELFLMDVGIASNLMLQSYKERGGK